MANKKHYQEMRLLGILTDSMCIFARMGEPTWNDNVLAFGIVLKEVCKELWIDS